MGFLTAAVLIAGTASAVATTSAANSQRKSINSAAEDARNQNAAAIQSIQDAQASASTNAQSSIASRRRAMSGSQSIYTSPLGLSEQASVSRNYLLGQ